MKKLEDHPRVIKFIDCFHYEKDQDIFCIVLEWAENGDLKDHLKKQGGQLAEFEVSRIVSQIVEGRFQDFLHFVKKYTWNTLIHFIRIWSKFSIYKSGLEIIKGILFFQKNNLVHRDFKLQNILLDKDKNIKITDFGLATELSHRNERMKTFCGTPNYLPPEMIARRGYSAQVDIWSLGVLLYHLLVGRPPLEPGESNTETMKRIQENDIFIPELLSTHAQDIIIRTLDKNPQTRITIDELTNHPFLIGHKKQRTMSDITENSRISEYEPRSRDVRDRSRSSSLIREVPPLQVSYPSTPSRKQPYRPERRIYSMERTPSAEAMPPPSKPTTSGRDKSTGYSSSMSDNSPKYGSKNSPGRSNYPKPVPNFEGHRKHRSQSERRKSESENLELPQIQVQRLMPTKIKTNKTVCSIRPDEKAYIEYLDEKQLVKYCMEVDCRSQTCTYYCPRDYRTNDRLPLASTPHLPKEEFGPEVFYFPNLPKKLQKTWMCLHKFVELVKAKTPKVNFTFFYVCPIDNTILLIFKGKF